MADILLSGFRGDVIKKNGICYEFVEFEEGIPDSDDTTEGSFQNCADYEQGSSLAPGGESSLLQEQGESSAVPIEHPVTQATAFNGINQYATRVDNASLSVGDIDFSFAGWFYIDSVISGDYNYIFAKGNEGLSRQIAYTFRINPILDPDRLEFRVEDGVTNAGIVRLPADDLVTGEWMFIYVAHDAAADELVISKNAGIPVTNGYTHGSYDDSSPFRLAVAPHFATSGWADARQGALAMWKRTLTQAEIAFLWQGGCGRLYDGIPASLKVGMISYWELDDGGTREDRHGSNSLSVTNGPPIVDGPCP